MLHAAPIITIVDDDESIRRALARLLRATGHETREFASAREYLAATGVDDPGCLLLDVRMPRLDGLELQTILNTSGNHRTIVFMSGHADVHASVRAMKSGAVDFLLKPISERELLDAVERALARDAELRGRQHDLEELVQRAATLTPREREVCLLVFSGLLNKQIATRLGTTEKTVKVHRGRVMAKMHASSLAELVRNVDRLLKSGAGRSLGQLPTASIAPSKSQLPPSLQYGRDAADVLR